MLLWMRTVTVPLGERSYSIFIGSNLLAQLGAECRRLGLGQRCSVITDTKVARHYAKEALRSLTAAGFEPLLVKIPPEIGRASCRERVEISIVDVLLMKN